jgi:pilus assembly protein Flp/PilA
VDRGNPNAPPLLCGGLKDLSTYRGWMIMEGGEYMISVFVADLRALLARALREEAGQGLTEYALILAFVSIVAIAALTLLGANVTSILNSVARAL